MFVDTEVEKKRTKTHGDGNDDDDIKRVKILLQKGQISPVNPQFYRLRLHTKVTEDHGDEEAKNDEDSTG